MKRILNWAILILGLPLWIVLGGLLTLIILIVDDYRDRHEKNIPIDVFDKE